MSGLSAEQLAAAVAMAVLGYGWSLANFVLRGPMDKYYQRTSKGGSFWQRARPARPDETTRIRLQNGVIAAVATTALLVVLFTRV